MPQYPPLGAIGAFNAGDALADRCQLYAAGDARMMANLVNGLPPITNGAGNDRDMHGPTAIMGGSSTTYTEWGSIADFTPGAAEFSVACLTRYYVDYIPLSTRTTSSNGGFDLLCVSTGTRLRIGTSTGTYETIDVAAINDGQYHLLVATKSGANLQLYRDGVAGTLYTTATGSITPTQTLAAGKRGTNYYLCGVAMVGYWTRALTAEDVQRLTEDPFRLTRPPTRQFYMRSVGGGADFSLAADAGSIVLTGSALGLKAGRTIGGAAGAFLLDGKATALAVARTLGLGAGSVALAGTATALELGRALGIGAGNLALTGTATGFTFARRLAADSGAYSLTGSAAALRVARALSANGAAIALTGTDLALYSDRGVALGAGAFALTGADAAIAIGLGIALDPGTFALTGSAAAFARALRLGIDAGEIVFTGAAASLSRGYRAELGMSAFALTGEELGFQRTYAVQFERGTFVMAGVALSLDWSSARPRRTVRHSYSPAPQRPAQVSARRPANIQRG